MKENVIVSWGGGKDSALALHEIVESGRYEIVCLLTTLTCDYDHVCMHGIRRVLLEQQADALGLTLEKVFVDKGADNGDYELAMREVLEKYLKKDVSSVVFGDIFLEDLRKYREDKLSKTGMKAIFPIWQKDTRQLARNFINLGYKAVVTCVDSKNIDKSFVGRNFDERFLSELPPGIDWCGENGEFHSFVHDGPIFDKPIPHVTGEIVLRENRFYFCDVKSLSE